MLDLGSLRDAGHFSVSGGPPRLALVHHGFRTTQLGIKDSRSRRFAPRFASLGLLSLARSLEIDFEEGRLPYRPEVKYFDEDCYADDQALADSISDWLAPAASRFVLAGLYSLAVERTASLLKRFDPDQVCIVVGGAHPTVAPELDFAHIVVRGEGGAAMRHILTTLFDQSFGEGLEARGVCFQLDGATRMDRPAFDRSLATLSPPAFPFELSQSEDDPSERPQVRWWMEVGSSPQIYICTQSCRARCTFCSTYLIHGSAVSRPVSHVAADLDYIIDRLKHDSLEFHDDDLLQHTEFDDLAELLRSRGITWTCNARAEFMTEEKAAQMAESGCRRVFLGVESFNQESLDYYHKATTVEMNERAVKVLDEAGIDVICGFILGAPHDTLESSLADIERMLSLPIYFLSPSILTPDIGTLEYHRAKRADPMIRRLADDETGLNMKPRPELFGTGAPYGMPTVCRDLSKDQLNELYELARSAFFLRAGTLERLRRHTSSARMGDLKDWYEWIASCASRLATSASIDMVSDRAGELILGWDGPLGGRFKVDGVGADA